MSKGVKSNSEIKNSSFVKEVFGMATVLFAVLAFLCLITGDSLFYTLGASVQGFFLGVFGIYSFVFIIDLTLWGLKLASGRSLVAKKNRKKYLVARVALFCLFVVLHLAISFKVDAEWGEQIAYAYKNGVEGFSSSTVSGAFGAFFLASIVGVASTVGTYLLFIIVFAICIFYLFRKPILSLFKGKKSASPQKNKLKPQKKEDDSDDEHDDERDYNAFNTADLRRERPKNYFLNEEEGLVKKSKKDIANGLINEYTPFEGAFRFKNVPGENDVLLKGDERSDKNVATVDLKLKNGEDGKIDLRERKDSVGDLGQNYRAAYNDYGKRSEFSDVIARDRTDPTYDDERDEKRVYTVPLGDDKKQEDTERARVETSPFGDNDDASAKNIATADRSKSAYDDVLGKDEPERVSFGGNGLGADNETDDEDMRVRHTEIRSFARKEEKFPDEFSDDEEEFDGENDVNASHSETRVSSVRERVGVRSEPEIDPVFASPRKKFVVEDDGSEPIENMPLDYKYNPPPITLLDEYKQNEQEAWEDLSRQKWCADTIVKVIKNKKGIDVKVENIVTGPAVTRYDISVPEPYGPSEIMSVRQDLAFRLETGGELRMYSVPYTSYIGIEIANLHARTVGLKDALLSRDYAETRMKKGLFFVFGEDLLGNTIIMNINAMPHLLVCGTTGSGKSVCLNVLLVSLLYRYSPAELRIIIVDPKKVEFKNFKGIPHLVFNEILGTDNRTVAVLEWVVQEMERRYDFIGDNGCKDIFEYNDRAEHEGGRKMPCLLVLIDEYADLVMAQQQNKKKIENYIERLAQKARAAGISLICATQRASVSVISGSIKTNIISKICFQTNSGVDSRVILDEQGAEKLLGHGDALYRTSGSGSLKRGQGAFMSNEEVKKVVAYIIENNKAYFDNKLLQTISDAANSDEEETLNKPQPVHGLPSRPDEVDEDFKRALRFAIKRQVVSGSSLRTMLRIGYNKSASIIAWMERMGYISPITENRMRKVQITRDDYERVYGEFVEDFDF